MTVFYSSEPCPNGHIGYRYISNNRCRECLRRASFEKRYNIKGSNFRVAHDRLRDKLELEKELKEVYE